MSYLPHFYPVGATFFITFRLADSIPQNELNQMKTEFNKREAQILKMGFAERKQEDAIHSLRRQTFGKYEHQLDGSKYGESLMNQTEVAKIIWDKIFEFDQLYYTTKAIAIMPNHVHMLLDTSIQLSSTDDIDPTAKEYVDVSKWMQKIKGGSAYLINKHLKRKGTVWAKESYDHYIRYRREGEYERILVYILQNPIKARLNTRFQTEPYSFSHKGAALNSLK